VVAEIEGKKRIHRSSITGHDDAVMGMVSLISALVGAQTGEIQLAVAARLARMGDPDNNSSISVLVGAVDQSANSLAIVADNIRTKSRHQCVTHGPNWAQQIGIPADLANKASRNRTCK
jgi:ubiquinone biosynthesis protein UbiJ